MEQQHIQHKPAERKINEIFQGGARQHKGLIQMTVKERTQVKPHKCKTVFRAEHIFQETVFQKNIQESQ